MVSPIQLKRIHTHQISRAEKYRIDMQFMHNRDDQASSQSVLLGGIHKQAAGIHSGRRWHRPTQELVRYALSTSSSMTGAGFLSPSTSYEYHPSSIISLYLRLVVLAF